MSSKASGSPKRKRVRPTKGKDPLIGLRLPSEVIDKLNAAATERGLSRSELVRRAILTALGLNSGCSARLD
jgi:hypothetical protein